MTRLVVLLLMFCAPLASAFAQAQPITFSTMGDVPYSSSEVPTLLGQIRDHNRYSPSEFLVHLGDIKSGSSSCTESYYRDMVTYLHGLAVPAYIVPGDNEYNDCSNVSQAWSWWRQYFNNFETTFCGSWPTEHQSVRQENFAFVRSGVLFIGINLVGGRVQSSSEWSQRLQQDATWVSQQFQAKGSQVRAAVIFSQAGPGSSAHNAFFTPFRPAAAAFGKPILFLHGDGHTWIMDHPFPETNVLRIQVENGGSEDPLQVTVTLNAQNPFQVRRDPWSGSPVVINMPPCVDAGPDQSVVLPATASLQGGATDDGDPASPGVLSYAWTQMSGPASVAFGDPSARITTAAFSQAGNYVLRLTANDGALQRSDDVAVTVTGTGQTAAMLSIDDVTVVEGNSGNRDAIITVHRSGDTSQPASADWATAPGTATAVSDYVTSSGRLDFAAAATLLSLRVPVVGDTDDEPDETFTVTLAAPSGAVLADAQGVGTIQDDDEPVAGGGSPGTPLAFAPMHDTQVNSSSPGSNYGNATTLRVKTDSSRYDSYLKFEVTGLATAVQSAKLRLYCTDASPAGGALYRVANEYPNTSNPWTETGLLWTNAPPILGTAVATLGAVRAGTWYELDVTAAVTGNGTYAFGLHSNDGDSAYYSSKEGSNRPQLVVVPASGPPPPPLPLTLASFTPPSGPVGTVVTITGTGFGAGIHVTFGGLAATQLSLDSSTSLRATVPAGAPSGPIVISTVTEQATSSSDFVVTIPAAVASFIAIEDAHVSSSYPASSYGAEKEMRLRAGSPTCYVFLKFAVTGTGGLVQSAKLRLYTTNDGPDGGAVFAVANEFRNTATPWQEETLNWNNAPVIGGPGLGNVGPPPLNTWIEVDVTAAIAGDGTYSFGLKNAATSSVYYASKEGTNKPVLVVTMGQALAAAPASTPAAASNLEATAAAPAGLEAAPQIFELRGSFPNPSHGRTRIEFTAPHDGRVRITIYNVRGQLVRRLTEQHVRAGAASHTWDGRDLQGRIAGAGVYLYDVEFERQHHTGKLILER